MGRWIGYRKKQDAKNKLTNNFEPELDYQVLLTHLGKQRGRGGHNREQIKLAVDCFKSLGMMAGTDKGKETLIDTGRLKFSTDAFFLGTQDTAIACLLNHQSVQSVVR